MTDALPTQMLTIGGRSGVGKSSVGYELHHLLVEAKVMHGYIEGDNLDQAYPEPWSDRLAEQNLHAMWGNYRALGHHRLIYTNTLSVLVTDDLVGAIDGPVEVIGVLLTADDESTAERLAQREIGSALDLHIRRSRQRATELEASPSWVHRVPTDGRTVREVADDVLALTDWLAS